VAICLAAYFDDRFCAVISRPTCWWRRQRWLLPPPADRTPGRRNGRS